MNILTKAREWFAEKTVFALNDWYARNGYYRLSGMKDSASSKYVGESSAFQLSAVYACVKIIAEDVGSLPLFVYQKSRDGKTRERATKHPLYRLLHDAPNPETCAIEFREALTAHAAFTGNGYARHERSNTDRSKTVALWQVQPQEMRTDRDSRNRLVYIHKEGNSAEKTLDISDVLHIRGFGMDGVSGLSFLRVARRTLGLALEQEEYAQKFFAGDHTPSIVLEHPGRLSPEAIPNIKAAWKKANDSHDVAVTQEGMKVNYIGKTNTEAQLTEQRRFELLQVLRYFRMPPHKVAELERATFSNIEQQSIEYYTNTLRPWLVRWEQAISRCLIGAAESLEYYAEHSIEGLLRGDFKTQTEGFAKLLSSGVLSINEVRGLLNLNPAPGGDERFIQLNMQTVANAAAAEDEPEPVAAAAAVSGPARLVRVKSL